MQSGDSIKLKLPVNKPLQITTEGSGSMILPSLEIKDISFDNSNINAEPQLPQERKIYSSRKGVVLTEDSTGYLIIPAKTEKTGGFNIPKFEQSVQTANTLYFVNQKDSVPSDSSTVVRYNTVTQQNITSNEVHTTVKKEDGFEGVKPNLRAHQDSTFVFVLICFFLIVYAIKTEGNKIKGKIKNILSTSNTDREQTTSMSFIAGSCLILQALLIYSVLSVNLFSKYLDFQPANGNIIYIALFILIIAVFIGIKMIIYNILRLLFTNERRSVNMRQKYIASIQLLGIASFLPIVMLLYSDGFDNILILLIGILFVCERLIAIYHVIINFLQEKINFLFLIAYLCTIEILPYFILYEIISFVYKLDITSTLWH